MSTVPAYADLERGQMDGDMDVVMGSAKRRRTFDMRISSVPVPVPVPAPAEEGSGSHADADAGATATGDAEGEANELEEAVVDWSELPDDMVAKIQARLPLVSLMRSRAVCRAWREAVESPRFLLEERLASRGGEPDPWMLFVAGTKNYGIISCGAGMSMSDDCVPSSSCGTSDHGIVSCAYDPATERWYPAHLPPCLLSIPDMGPEDQARSVALLPGRLQSSMSQVSMSAGGGVVLANKMWEGEYNEPEGHGHQHLGNPVAGSWTCLRGGGLPLVRGMFVDTTARCFKLVQVSDPRSEPSLTDHPETTYVFDSALGIWSATSRFLPAAGVLDPELCPGVFLGTVLYCLDEDWNLVSYDLEGATWNWLAVVKPAQFDTVYCTLGLIKVQDRLLCVAVGEDPESCVQIWELNFARMAWMVVNTMPAPMLDGFRQSRIPHCLLNPWEYIRVAAGQDRVYIMTENLDTITCLDFRQSPPAWRLIPASPYSYTSFQAVSVQCVDPWLDFSNWN